MGRVIQGKERWDRVMDEVCTSDAVIIVHSSHINVPILHGGGLSELPLSGSRNQVPPVFGVIRRGDVMFDASICRLLLV